MGIGEQTASIESLDDYELADDTGDEGAPGTYFLGRYRVVDEIGVGGMASVHLARADGAGGFQKWVAIKRIHPHLIEDDQFIHMFLDEARIAARISHANVAQVFDLGEGEGTYWIAMEYLHGEPLREILRCTEDGRKPRLSYALAAKIVADAGDGLHAAHELTGKDGESMGLVHRDVTPHNLFVTYTGTTKVVDFGIAKVAGRLSNTRAGTLKGKLAYMSPEQVRGAEVDRGTDIFALGVVLWEITTGQRLFRMDSDLETLERVQRCAVPLPSTIRRDYPAELEAIVMKALAPERHQRFGTAREFSRALQQYIVRGGGFVGPEDVAEYLQTILGERIRKRDEHLRWAAEVTQTRAGGGRPDVVMGQDAEVSMDSYHSEVRAPRPAAGIKAHELGNETRFEGTPSVSSAALLPAVPWGPPASHERPNSGSGAALSPPNSYTPPPPHTHGLPPPSRLPGPPVSSPPAPLPSPGQGLPSGGYLPPPSALPPPRAPSAAPGSYGHGGYPQTSDPYAQVPGAMGSGSLPPLSAPSLPPVRGYPTPLPPPTNALPSFGSGSDPDDDYEEDVHTVIHMGPPSASMNVDTFGLIDDEAKTTAVIAQTPAPTGFATPLPAAGTPARRPAAQEPAPAYTPAPMQAAVPVPDDGDEVRTTIGRPYGEEDAESKSEATRAGPVPTPSAQVPEIPPVSHAVGESSVLTPPGQIVIPTSAPSEGIGPMPAVPGALGVGMGMSAPALGTPPPPPAAPGVADPAVLHAMNATQPAPLPSPVGAAPPMPVPVAQTNKPAALMAVIAVAAVVVAAGVMFLVYQKSRPQAPSGAPIAAATTAPTATATTEPTATAEPARTANPYSTPLPPETAPPPSGTADATAAPPVTAAPPTTATATPTAVAVPATATAAPPTGRHVPSVVTATPTPTPTPVGTPGTKTIDRTPPKPADAGDTGTLVVRCDPACDSVQANSRSLGPSPVNTKLPAGTYTIRLRRSGGPSKSTSATIVAGKTARVQMDMK